MSHTQNMKCSFRTIRKRTKDIRMAQVIELFTKEPFGRQGLQKMIGERSNVIASRVIAVYYSMFLSCEYFFQRPSVVERVFPLY